MDLTTETKSGFRTISSVVISANFFCKQHSESMSPDLAELVNDNERLQMKVHTLQEESSTMSNYIEQLNLQV